MCVEVPGSGNTAHQQYSKALLSAKERELVEQMNEEHREKMEQELKRLREKGAEERAIDMHREHVVEKILTLACPRCSQAFVDFSNCFALTCSRCTCHFCAYCLKDSGYDPEEIKNHEHVRTCKYSKSPGNYFGTEENFNLAQRERRQRMLSDYMNSIQSASIRTRVAQACRPYTTEHELVL